MWMLHSIPTGMNRAPSISTAPAPGAGSVPKAVPNPALAPTQPQPLRKGDAAGSWLLPKQYQRKNTCSSTRVRKRRIWGCGWHPLAQAPGTGASVSTRSLGTSVAELTLAGACSRLALPTAAFPSASPHGLEGIQHPHSPQWHCTWHAGHRRVMGTGSRMGVPPHSTSGSPIAPSPEGSVPLPPAPGAGGGRGRIRACLGHVPSFSA